MKLTKKIITALLLISILLSALASCTVSKRYEGAPDGMRPICDGSEGAILYVPENWQVDTSTGIPTAYYSSNDRSTVSLITVDAAALDGKDAKDYWMSYKETFASTLTDFTINKESATEKDYTTRLIGNAAAYIFDFSAKVTGIEFRFRQAVFTDPTSGDLFMITYSAQKAVFDNHVEDLSDIYDNFRFVTEPIPMTDKTEPAFPDAEGVVVPEGYVLLSGEFVDYVMFVPSDWIPLVTTGMSAACAPDNKDVTVGTVVFSVQTASLDAYWEEYENDLKSTYGDVRYTGENKYVETKIDGYVVRKYSYETVVTGTAYAYEQYVYINGGYVILLTCSARAEDFDSYRGAFDGIASVFKYK